MRARNLILMAMVAIGGCKCDDDSTNPCDVIPDLCEIEEQVPVYADVASTTPQTGVAGTEVADPPAIRVTTDTGPLVGCYIVWHVTSGGGEIWGPPPLAAPATEAVTTTNGSGVGRLAGWMLGPSPGTNQVRVTSVTCLTVLTNPTIRSGTFEATALEPSPAEIIKVEGDQQTAAVGATATPSPRVRVLAGQNLPLPNVTVTFSVIGGGGLVGGSADAAVTTDSDGYATAPDWVFGTTIGTNNLQASVPDLVPVVFEATTTAGAPRQVAAASAPTGTPGQIASPAAAVTVTDAFGNPVPGTTVGFDITAGGGTIAAATSTTDGTGTAAAPDWTLGAAAGLNTLVATVLSGGQRDPQVQGNPVSFDVTTAAAGTLIVSVTIYGAPTPGVGVSLTGTSSAQGTTGTGGTATFPGLSPGPYTVTISPPAGPIFPTLSQQITIVAGQTSTVDFEGYGDPVPATQH